MATSMISVFLCSISQGRTQVPPHLSNGQTLMDIKRLPCEYYAGMVRAGRDVRISRASLQPWSWILSTGGEILYFIGRALKTLFLFTKSDFKTIIAPVLVIILSLNTPSPLLILQSVFWTWLHVLQCALANQTLSPEEDALNKPDRPIPSGRISQQDARLLRWLCIIPCLALSFSYGIVVFKASAWLSIFLYIYNELSFNAHWLSRNLLNGAGLACFEIGATLITADDNTRLAPAAIKAIILSSSVFVTTIHTQDFKDVLGDKEIGRTTLPLIFPKASRISILVLLPLWSFLLQWLWGTNQIVSYFLVALSIIIGGRFVFKTSVLADQRSFLLYNVWLCLTHLLPAL